MIFFFAFKCDIYEKFIFTKSNKSYIHLVDIWKQISVLTFQWAFVPIGKYLVCMTIAFQWKAPWFFYIYFFFMIWSDFCWIIWIQSFVNLLSFIAIFFVPSLDFGLRCKSHAVCVICSGKSIEERKNLFEVSI